jgi:hypothetical protein
MPGERTLGCADLGARVRGPVLFDQGSALNRVSD